MVGYVYPAYQISLVYGGLCISFISNILGIWLTHVYLWVLGLLPDSEGYWGILMGTGGTGGTGE